MQVIVVLNPRDAAYGGRVFGVFASEDAADRGISAEVEAEADELEWGDERERVEWIVERIAEYRKETWAVRN